MSEQLHPPVKDKELLSERAHDSIRGRSLRDLEEEDARLVALTPEEQDETIKWHYNVMKRQAH